MWISFKTFSPTCCYVVVGPEKLTMALFRTHRIELNLIGTYAMKTSKKRREENEMETKKKHRVVRIVALDMRASTDFDGFVEIRCELNANR